MWCIKVGPYFYNVILIWRPLKLAPGARAPPLALPPSYATDPIPSSVISSFALFYHASRFPHPFSDLPPLFYPIFVASPNLLPLHQPSSSLYPVHHLSCILPSSFIFTLSILLRLFNPPPPSPPWLLLCHGCLKLTFVIFSTKILCFTLNNVGKPMKMPNHFIISSFQFWNLINLLFKIGKCKPIYWYFWSI